MTDPDRLAERLERTWVTDLTENIGSQIHPPTDDTNDCVALGAIEIRGDDDWLKAVEVGLFEQLWNGAGATVEQDGHVIDFLRRARKTLTSAGFGSDQAFWILHPETRQHIVDRITERVVYPGDPNTLVEYQIMVSPALPKNGAVLVDTNALVPNPRADIPSALSAWSDTCTAIDVLSPFTIRYEDGIVAVEFADDLDQEAIGDG